MPDQIASNILAIQKVKGIGIAGDATAVAVALFSALGGNTIPVGSTGVKVSSTITRPNDTNPYIAGDIISDSTSAPTVASLSGIAGQNGGSGVILNALLIDSANQSTAGAFEVWIFHTAPAAQNDNAAFAPSDAETLNLVAVIPFNTSFIGTATAGAGGNRIYQTDPLHIAFKCDGNDSKLYWALVVRNGYTPVAQEALTLKVFVAQD